MQNKPSEVVWLELDMSRAGIQKPPSLEKEIFPTCRPVHTFIKQAYFGRCEKDGSYIAITFVNAENEAEEVELKFNYLNSKGFEIQSVKQTLFDLMLVLGIKSLNKGFGEYETSDWFAHKKVVKKQSGEIITNVVNLPIGLIVFNEYFNDQNNIKSNIKLFCFYNSESLQTAMQLKEKLDGSMQFLVELGEDAEALSKHSKRQAEFRDLEQLQKTTGLVASNDEDEDFPF